MNYLCSENKGADQLRGYREADPRLCFRICKKLVFSRRGSIVHYQVIIADSERPKQKYYFLYNGWIAKDEGEGKLWREITAKKSLPKELKEGNENTKHVFWVVSGLPGAKVHRGTKHLSDLSHSYNITTIELPTTIPVHLTAN